MKTKLLIYTHLHLWPESIQIVSRDMCPLWLLYNSELISRNTKLSTYAVFKFHLKDFTCSPSKVTVTMPKTALFNTDYCGFLLFNRVEWLWLNIDCSLLKRPAKTDFWTLSPAKVVCDFMRA